MCTQHLRPRPGLLLLLLALAALASPSPASAQGTAGMLPDPISSRELTTYADRLGLSDQQRLAIETFHEQYRTAFRHLRDTEIESFLQDSGGLGNMGMGADPESVERTIRDFERLMTKIKSLDDRLLDDILSVLTDDQAMMMPRVRQTRQRARLGSGLGRMVGFLNPASRVDLAEIVEQIDLPSPEREAIDPVLQSYESSLTTKMRDLHEESLDMAREATKAMSSIEIDEQALMENPERRREMLTAIRTMWTELTGRMTRQSMEISDLGRRTIPRLEPLMRPESAFDLHQRFYRQGYREYADGANPAVAQLAKALKLEGLSEEQRQAVGDLQTGFFRDIYRLTGEAADVIDEQRRTRQIMRFGADNEAVREHEEKLDELRTRRTTANERAIATLQALLGPEQAAALPEVIAHGGADDEAGATFSGIVTSPGGRPIAIEATPVDGGEASTDGQDPYLPGPIAPRDVVRYANLLELDENARIVLTTLHHDYEESFREQVGEAAGRVAKARQTLWQFGEDGQMSPPSEADVARLYSLRRRVLELVNQLDALFFADVSALVPEDRPAVMERIALSRQRDVYNRGRGSGRTEGGAARGIRFAAWQMDGSREATIDVARLIEPLDLEVDSRAAIEEPLLEYERTATGAFRTFYEADMRYQEALDVLNARSAQRRRSGQEPGRGWSDDYRRLMEEQGRAARQARRALITLNRTTIERLAGILPEASADTVRRTYEQRAFPDEFSSDGGPASSRLTAALQLPDLTAEQRSAVVEISAEFNAGYEQLSRRMVGLRMRTVETSEDRDWRQRLEGQRDVEKLRSERDDLGEKALVRLRTVLSEQQMEKVEGSGIRD